MSSHRFDPLSRDSVYCAKALWHLARARLRFSRHTTEQLVRWLETAEGRDQAQLPSSGGPVAVDLSRMRWALAAVGSRVPWRADCLIQVLAARQWLSRAGIASIPRFGAKRNRDGSLAAHAWLEVAGKQVTGGSVEGLAPFVAAAGRSS